MSRCRQTIERASAVDSRFEALRAGTTPLVGRDEEIELLMRLWQQAKGGDGCVVLIAGEPGIGKSRIPQTVVERLSGEPYTRLRYFAHPTIRTAHSTRSSGGSNGPPACVVRTRPCSGWTSSRRCCHRPPAI